jgi:DNA-binding CsgD family transcriptional regulator
MTRRRDAIHFVESLYGGAEETESTWMKTVVAAAAPLFGPSTVVAMSRLDLSGAASRVRALEGVSREVSQADMVASITGQPTSEWHRLTSVPVTVLSEHFGADTATRPGIALLRANDVLGISTRIGDEALILASTLSSQLRIDARSRRWWSRLSAHLAAAARLRARPVEADAILTPSGKVEHAEEAARPPQRVAALRRAVREIEAARGTLRRSHPERALAMWTALVDGRWSLVDRFDGDGRRFVVARKNPPRSAKARALDPMERAAAHLAVHGRSNKQIAYELGLAEATVSGLLRSSAGKVGARSRVELVGVLAALERGGDEAADR